MPMRSFVLVVLISCGCAAADPVSQVTFTVTPNDASVVAGGFTAVVDPDASDAYVAGEDTSHPPLAPGANLRMFSTGVEGAAAMSLLKDARDDQDPLTWGTAPPCQEGDDIVTIQGFSMGGIADPDAVLSWQITGDIRWRWFMTVYDSFTGELLVDEFELTSGGTLNVDVTVVGSAGYAYDFVIRAFRGPDLTFDITPAPYGTAPLTLTFDATDTAENLVAWNWVFGPAGSVVPISSTSEVQAAVYHQSGTYTVQLQVTDDEGHIGSASRPVTVLEGGDYDPQAGASILAGAGGSVEVAGGTLDGVKVTVPAGALPQDTVVVISELANPPTPPAGSIGVPFDIAPSGITFNTPVTVEVPHAAGTAHLEDVFVVHYDQASGTWKSDGISDVTHTVVDATTHLVTFKTTHTSIFAVGSQSGTVTPAEDDDDGHVEEDDGGCFVATAAFGSPMARQVESLRHLRDGYLLRCAVGREFVRAYYRYGPKAADFIAGRDDLRAEVRLLLRPLVRLAEAVDD